MSQNKHKINILPITSAFFAILLSVTFSIGTVFAKESPITAKSVIGLVNDARAVVGVGRLEENSQLSEAAKQKAEDMIKNGYFAHTSPSGVSPWFWFDNVGYDYLFAGENLAINFKNAEDQQHAWMESPLHRKNILNDKYKEIGVASLQGMINGQESVVTVQLFGTIAQTSSQTLPIKKMQTEVAPQVKQTKEVDKDNDEVEKKEELKPFVLSIQPASYSPPSTPGQYSGMIAVSLTLLALALVAVSDVAIVFRKRKTMQELHQRI